VDEVDVDVDMVAVEAEDMVDMMVLELRLRTSITMILKNNFQSLIQLEQITKTYQQLK
jgi:hypothetical protein